MWEEEFVKKLCQGPELIPTNSASNHWHGMLLGTRIHTTLLICRSLFTLDPILLPDKQKEKFSLRNGWILFKCRNSQPSLISKKK